MELTVRVVDPDQIVFEGTAQHVLVPGVRSQLGIFPTHTPLYAELTAGTIIIDGEKETTIEISSGVIKVLKDVVTILIIHSTEKVGETAEAKETKKDSQK